MSVPLRTRRFHWAATSLLTAVIGTVSYTCGRRHAEIAAAFGELLRVRETVAISLSLFSLAAFLLSAMLLAGLSISRREAIEVRKAASDVIKGETRYRLLAAKLRNQTKLLQSILDSMGEGVVVVDREQRVVELNPAARRMIGDRWPGRRPRTWRDFLRKSVPPESMDEARFGDPIASAIAGEQPAACQLVAAGPTVSSVLDVRAQPLRDQHGAIQGAVAVFRDVTELRALSLRDDLTGLYNRRGFTEVGAQQLKLAHRAQHSLMLFFVDLDGLKAINDGLGHDHGDSAIADAGRLLRNVFRESDVIARLGGDEFVVLAPEFALDALGLLHGRLAARLAAFNQHSGRPYHLSMSIGWAAYDPAHPCDINELVQRADQAMYEQKRAGKVARRAESSPPESLVLRTGT